MRKLTYKLLLLDDQPGSLRYILNMLADLPFIAEPVLIDNLEEAFDYLKENEVDILFLDMDFRREDMSGIHFLRTLKNPPLTVACSAYTEFVFETVEVGIRLYIGKVISFNIFEEIMLDLVEEVDRKAEGERRDVKVLAFSDVLGNEISLVVDDIFYAEVDNNIVTVVTGDEEYKFKMSLKALQLRLPADAFVRIHNSFLVSLAKVVTVQRRQVYFSGQRSAVVLRVTQEYYKEFKHALMLYKQNRER